MLKILKCSGLDKWLLQSTWGKKKANWPANEELSRFEQCVNKPGAQLAIVRSAPQGWMDRGRAEWQLQLSLPAYLKGQTIGLRIVSQPLAKAGQRVPSTDITRYQAAMRPKELISYNGHWNGMVYSLPLEVDTGTAIKLELGYMGSMTSQSFFFKGIGNDDGPMQLDIVTGALDSMPALIVGSR